MEAKIINIGENPSEIRYKFIKNAGVKSKMIFGGFNKATALGQTYVSDIPRLTLYFTSRVCEVHKDTAVKLINIYDVQDEIIENNNSKTIDDIKKMSIKVKLNSLNQYLDVDISGINKDNKMVSELAESFKKQYEHMKKFPEAPVGIGGSWVMFSNSEHSNHTYLYTLREMNNSVIKYDYMIYYFSTKEQLKKKNTDISLYKEFSGSGIINVSSDIATGDSESKFRNFSTAISEMKNENNSVLHSEQTLIMSVDFSTDLPPQTSNVNDILTNIKNNKLYS